jgi:UDP-N-acetylmuramoylalanine--D-glutamate ligase
MKLAILGYGVEGKSAYKYWRALGADITICNQDDKPEFPEGARVVTGPDYLKHLDDFDLVVRSPGVKPWEVKTKTKVTSVTGEFLARCPARVIGVTGTKGKGTTATLITRILGEAGWRTHLGGNIGVPPLDFLSKVRASHLVVLELSSFQLIDLELSPHFAVCLTIAGEHLDWHRGMNEYVAAKGNIFWHQEPDDVAIYNAHNDYATQIAQLSVGEKIPYLEPPGAVVKNGQVMIDGVVICGVDEVGLIGPHNLENVCAAVTTTWELVNRNPEPVRRAVKAFTGLPHRLDPVRELGRVKYMNDSFSANPIAAMAAIKSFAEPKILILGGMDRGLDFGPLVQAVADGGVKQVVLVGQTTQRMAAAFNAIGFDKYTLGGTRMPEIVAQAQRLAKPGDVVVLSPAAPSFDMFTNFQDRGLQFEAAVKALKA